MVENKTKVEQLFEQTKEAPPSSGGGNKLKEKISGTVAGIRNLFSKPWLRPGPKVKEEAKAAPALLAGIFSAHKLDLKSVNQAFSLILVGLIALTVYVAFGEHPSISSVTAAASKVKFRNLEDKVITSFEELAVYLDQIKQRDIFNKFTKPEPPPVVKPKEPPPPPPKVTIQDRARGLKLMGISWGRDPKVIIMNESTQEVLFVEEGQKIKGTELRVREILKSKVVIGFEEEQMDML